jgi:hypothetical membrane protein
MSTARRQARRLSSPAAGPVRSSPAARRWAIVSAGLAPILLTGAYLMAGLLQPASYSPVRETISAMAGQAGTDRWVMTGGIALTGGCYLVTAAGLTGIRASARALLIMAGLAGIGIAASPEPARGATPQHLAWTVLGAVTIAVWPAFAARRASLRPPILGVCRSAAVTAVFVALLGWLFAETCDGSVLGLAERLTSSIQTCWPFIVALTLRRTRRPRPGPAAGGSGGMKDGVLRGPGPATAGRTGDGSPPGGAAGGRPARDRRRYTADLGGVSPERQQAIVDAARPRAARRPPVPGPAARRHRQDRRAGNSGPTLSSTIPTSAGTCRRTSRTPATSGCPPGNGARTPTGTTTAGPPAGG